MGKLVVGITAPLSIVLLEGQLNYFNNHGFEVYLMAPSTMEVKEFCEKEGAILLPVDIVRDISIIKDIKAFFQIYSHIHKLKPEILNVGTPKMALLGTIAGYFNGIKKRVYTCRGFRFEHEDGLKREILILMEKVTSKLAHQIICISPSVKEMGIKERIFTESKTIVFGRGSSNGLNLSRYNIDSINKTKRMTLAHELGIANKFVYGFVGRIIDRKGVKELFVAFCQLYNQDQNIHLLIVGKANPEQLSDKNLIKEMEKHPGVTLTGFKEEIPLYMSLFDVFILPSWWEGFGNTLIQAAAMGLPIISTNVTGCKDAVNNGINGILIKEKSVDEIREKMKFLYMNKAVRENLGKNGLLWAKEFDSLNIWKGMKELYENII